MAWLAPSNPILPGGLDPPPTGGPILPGGLDPLPGGPILPGGLPGPVVTPGHSPPVTAHPVLPTPRTTPDLRMGSPAYTTGVRYLEMCGGQLSQCEDGPVMRVVRGDTIALFRWDGTNWTWQNGRTDNWRNWVPTSTGAYSTLVPPLTQAHHQFLDAVAARLATLTAHGGDGAQAEMRRFTGAYDMFHRFMASNADQVGTHYGEKVYAVYNNGQPMRFRWNAAQGRVEYSRSLSDFHPNPAGEGMPVSTWVSIDTERHISDSNPDADALYRVMRQVRTLAPSSAPTATTFTAVQTQIDNRQSIAAFLSVRGGERVIPGRRVWAFQDTDLQVSIRQTDGVVQYSSDSGTTWTTITASSPLPYTGSSLTARQTAGNNLITSLVAPVTRNEYPAPASNVDVSNLMRQLITRAGGSRMTYIEGSNEYMMQLGVATVVYFRPVEREGRTEWEFSFYPPRTRTNTQARSDSFRPISEFATSVPMTGPDGNSDPYQNAARLVSTLQALQTGAAGSAEVRDAAMATARTELHNFEAHRLGRSTLMLMNGVDQPRSGGHVTTVTEHPEVRPDGSSGTYFRVVVPMPDGNTSHQMDYRFNTAAGRWEWRRWVEDVNHEFFMDWVEVGDSAPSDTTGDNRFWRTHNQIGRILRQYNRR